MSITTTTTRISRQWLERKPKHKLASIIMANIDKIELFAEERDAGIENPENLELRQQLGALDQKKLEAWAERDVAIERVKILEAALAMIPSLGHNTDCLFCGFKDRFSFKIIAAKGPE